MLLFGLIQISDSNYADYYCEWCRLNANTCTLHLIECFQLLKMYINKYVTHFYILCQMFYYIFPLSIVLLFNTSWYVAEGSRVLYKAFREAYRELLKWTDRATIRRLLAQSSGFSSTGLPFYFFSLHIHLFMTLFIVLFCSLKGTLDLSLPSELMFNEV